MHIQRALLLPPAVLGAVAIGLTFAGVLPWVTPSFVMAGGMPAEEAFQWKIPMNSISLVCFIMAMVMTFVGGVSRPMSLIGRLMIFVLSLVPLATALLVIVMYSTSVIELFDWGMTMEAELFWPGLATWGTLSAALVLLLTALVLGRFGRGASAAATEPKAQEQPS